MPLWESFKVTELKEECKARDISLTGLKLKQQFIDKLIEYEAAESEQPDIAEQSVAEKTNGAFQEVAKDEPMLDAQPSDTVEDLQDGEIADPDDTTTEEIPLMVENDKNLPNDRPAALKVEDSQGLDDEVEDNHEHAAGTVQPALARETSDMLFPESEQVKVETETTSESQAQPDPADAPTTDAEQELREAAEGPAPSKIVDSVQNQDSDIATTDSESRKRKRRSHTPPPDTQEVAKRAKIQDGSAIPSKRGSRSPSSRRPSQTSNTEQLVEPHEAQSKREVSAEPTNTEAHEDKQSRSRTTSLEREDIVEPALHAATCSVYIKNFKRPINVQTLRSHIQLIAQGSSSVPPNTDPIKFFNINNIRSHVFVSFSNITAASRVRAAMHGTKFPDEPQREPLSADFVPDDKVESWVDREASGSRGSGRNTASRLEVAYKRIDGGMEAVFQEVGPSQYQRPSISATTNNRSSFAQRLPSYTADPTRTAAIASEIHPDRATLVPRSPESRRRSSPARASISQRKSVDKGHGFGDLDDIFSSTQTKPKLYFKLPSQDVIDDRLDMIKDLYSDRGVPGHPGMKRYTFQRERAGEEWVDNGFEFGRGRKGQDRFDGIGGRGRGGFRGRGRGRGGFSGGGGGASGDYYRGRGDG